MDYNTVNIAVELLCVCMLSVLLVSKLFSTDRKKPQNLVFTLSIGLNMIMLSSDALSRVFDKRPDELYRLINIVSNFIYYIAGTVCIGMLIFYIVVSIPLNKTAERRVMRIIWSIVVSFCVLVVISQFTGWVYSVDAGNIYQWGPYYLTTYFAHFLINSVGIVIIAQNWHKLGTRKVAYFIYATLPLTAFSINLMVPGLMIAHCASAMTILIAYVSIHLQNERAMIEQELALTNARISVMLSQIKPHFLYNALAVISRLCDKDPAQAKKATIEFSSYLRGNMDSLEETKLISFEKELKHIEGFINLEKAMYGEALNVIYDIKAKDFFLPALTVQSIVENAIKHGIGKREGGGTVMICTDEADNEFLISVSDNGVGFDYDKAAHNGRLCIGINNVRQRLAGQCGGSLEIKSETGTGSTVTISIPKS